MRSKERVTLSTAVCFSLLFLQRSSDLHAALIKSAEPSVNLSLRYHLSKKSYLISLLVDLTQSVLVHVIVYQK